MGCVALQLRLRGGARSTGCSRARPVSHPSPPPRLQCAANPAPILLGFVAQYSVLPMLAVLLSRLMALPPAFATGLILLGCCPGQFVCRRRAPAVLAARAATLPPTRLPLLPQPPSKTAGGQASNVATFVARGDVALSVLMTAASTVAATVMTPFLTSVLAGAYIPVDGWVRCWRLLGGAAAGDALPPPCRCCCPAACCA